jgi:hypothetical protein
LPLPRDLRLPISLHQFNAIPQRQETINPDYPVWSVRLIVWSVRSK